jgi:predicted transcriptional regulator of viral defense system
MKLPRIYEHFKQGQVFTIDEAREKLGTTGNTLRKRLSELASRNYIFQIRQGLYQIAVIGDSHHKPQTSPFAIASKLSPYCYLGYKSALTMHAKEVPTEDETVFVVSPTKFNHFKYEKITYFWCQTPEPHGLETYFLNDHLLEFPVLATNFEKSIVDCLKRPAHCPSFAELIRLCEAIEKLPDIQKILRYASDCQVQSLYNRIGFLFEQNKERWHITDTIFSFIESKMSRKLTDWPIHTGQTEQSRHQSDQTTLETASLSLVDYVMEGKSRWKIQFQERVI